METELRKQILNFVSDKYKKSREVPSISKILNYVKVNRARFYTLFPSGIVEVCKLAGIPIPKERIEATSKAIKSKKVETKAEPQSLRIELTQQQQKELLGMAHLQGKDPTFILDELLKLHRKMFLNGIKLERLNSVLKAMEIAENRGWGVNEFVEFATELYNLLHFAKLDFETIKKLHDILIKAKDEGKDIDKVCSTFEQVFKIQSDYGIDLTSFNFKFLDNTLKVAIKRKWNPTEFVNYITQSYNTIVELREKISELKNEIKDLETTIENLKVEKEAKEEEISQLEKEYEDKKKKMEIGITNLTVNLAEKYNQQKALLKVVEKEISEKQKMVSELQEKIEYLEKIEKTENQKLEEIKRLERELTKKLTPLIAANCLFKFLRKDFLVKGEVKSLIQTLKKLCERDSY